ncbi:uncharacterized protein LOC103575922 [Microplitis demolitor]|uniref:uncharacterized protein LOC103575922 n=1 Tax=Microplitis demolitor TaxID=69319 RepID=UPI0004CDA073|nr:uncharacterized protein LOC103575922 [Microplitis demolitor]
MNSLLICFIVAVSLNQVLSASVPANPDTSKPNPGSDDVVAQVVSKLSEQAGSFKNILDNVRQKNIDPAVDSIKDIVNKTNSVIFSTETVNNINKVTNSIQHSVSDVSNSASKSVNTDDFFALLQSLRHDISTIVENHKNDVPGGSKIVDSIDSILDILKNGIEKTDV